MLPVSPRPPVRLTSPCSTFSSASYLVGALWCSVSSTLSLDLWRILALAFVLFRFVSLFPAGRRHHLGAPYQGAVLYVEEDGEAGWWSGQRLRRRRSEGGDQS